VKWRKLSTNIHFLGLKVICSNFEGITHIELDWTGRWAVLTTRYRRQLLVHDRWLQIHSVIPVQVLTIFDLNIFGKMFSDLKQAPLDPTLRILKHNYLEGAFDMQLLHFGNED
jgi:hypothetical protein